MKDCPSMEDSVTQSFKKYNETLTQESAVKEVSYTAFIKFIFIFFCHKTSYNSERS